MMPTGCSSKHRLFILREVSILVLLDDAYRRNKNGTNDDFLSVSILVLLDDAYRPIMDGNAPAKQA